MTDYDLLIIGGGINGTGIARDAAGRDLKVLLVEMNDLASATSSKSTKLIHGGLRYLEYFEFLLVRKALNEREILLKAAPHIIHPLKFILPHEKHLRPKWVIRLGLFLYDHLGMRKTLGRSRQIRLDSEDKNNPLLPRFTDGFTYYDCAVDDARLVVLNALDARELGAEILTRTKFLTARNMGDHWQAEIRTENAERRTVTAKVIINAAGPWVSDIIDDSLSLPAHNRLRLVKGSHIIVPQLFKGQDAYILQNADGRIIFAIPYAEQYTLIGTTDVPYDGDPAEVKISDGEIDYLCEHINAYFKPTLAHGRPLSADDVISHFSGVRPLYDDATKEASAVTRDFVLALREDTSQGNRGAPLLSIFGGKITTYRHLAEKALERLEGFFPEMIGPWTADMPLPGGNIVNMEKFIRAKQAKYPWLDKALCARYAHLYGQRMDDMLDKESPNAVLIGPGLYDYEADFLVTQEWAITPEDILWRRTKLGLDWSETDVENLGNWLRDQISS
ncbi:Aerobic glycerol-3-phosphate dehydrogenase [hydrothermal vent metagenome]|uniref:Aerobic glycerol-3-phosphate dehydrogenase n=1 Tax=hydrothermal vent metagenome TaxID=652676 RepID=A0A3B0T2F6_9ZZZZ